MTSESDRAPQRLEDVVLAAAKAAIPAGPAGAARRSDHAARTRAAADGKSGAHQHFGATRPADRRARRLAAAGAPEPRFDPARCRALAAAAPARKGAARTPSFSSDPRISASFAIATARDDDHFRRRRLGILRDAAARGGQGRDRTPARRLLRAARQRRADRLSRRCAPRSSCRRRARRRAPSAV